MEVSVPITDLFTDQGLKYAMLLLILLRRNVKLRLSFLKFALVNPFALLATHVTTPNNYTGCLSVHKDPGGVWKKLQVW